MGTEIPGGGEEELHCSPLSPAELFCIKMGSAESHFNVPFIVRDS